MADRALALVPNTDAAAAAKRKRGGGDDDNGQDNDAALAAPPGSASDPSLALVVPATGGPAITKAEYEKRLKDVRVFCFLICFFYSGRFPFRPLPLEQRPSLPPSLSPPHLSHTPSPPFSQTSRPDKKKKKKKKKKKRKFKKN